MSERPIGIRDLIEEHPETGSPEFGMHWLWCRRHEQAHKFGESCCTCVPVHTTDMGTRHAGSCNSQTWNRACIDVGPFMTKQEAERLGGRTITISPVRGHYKFQPALGMEVEE